MSSTRHAYGATNTSISRKNRRRPHTWTGRTPSWCGSGEKNRTSGVGMASLLGGKRGIEGEQVAGLALERRADRLERGEADRLRLAGLQHRQVGDRDVDARGELGQRHAPRVQLFVEPY